MAQNFLSCDRDQALLMPLSLRDWRAQDELAWCMLDVVAEMDLAAIYGGYRVDGHGRAAAGRPRSFVLRARLLGRMRRLGFARRQLPTTEAPRGAAHVRRRDRDARRRADPTAVSRRTAAPYPVSERAFDSSLGAMIGAFLVLHALLHLVLAVSLSTSSYLVLSRIIDGARSSPPWLG